MRRISTLLLVFALVAGVTGLPTPAEARDKAPSVVVKVTGEAEIKPNGDGHITFVMRWPAEAYATIKKENPNPRKFLREFAGHRADAEYAEASAMYDDSQNAVILRMIQQGGMKTLGQGRWMLQMEGGMQFEKMAQENGRHVLYLRQQGLWNPNVGFIGSLVYRLPPGATQANYNPGNGRLTYTLQRAAGTGAPVIDTELRAKKRLMTAIYKVYGLGQQFGSQWVAKTVFRNNGNSTVRDLRVRYRIPGYSEWSLWQKFKEVVPGQTAVTTYYPVLEEKIARLSSNTPADVRVEWKFKDAQGQEHTDSDGERITLLGVHEFVFTDIMRGENFGTWHEQFANAPMLAAWVSRDDPAIKQFASMANKNAGGLGATQSVENAVTVLKAIYELMRKNNITYQYPPTLRDHSVSFDPQQVQNVKFPRDVLRDRSGTCIDLAILYAAAANNLGIPSYLALVPGHVFPIFMLPNGRMIGVESTGVGGGLRFGSASFEKMLQMGMWEQEHWTKDGRYFLIDVRDLWSKGISNPELPELPADILERWGISTGDKITPTDVPPGRPIAPGLPPGFQIPGTTQERAPQGQLQGTWAGKVTERAQTGATFDYPLAVRIVPAGDGTYQVTSYLKAEVPQQGGGVTTVEIRQVYLGKIEGGKLVAQGRNKTLNVNGQQREAAPDVLQATLDGNALVGKFGAADGSNATAFRLPPFQEEGAQPSQPPRPTQPAGGASPFNGVWYGILEETLPNGSPLRYPLAITIERQQDGSFIVLGRARAEATGANGQKVVLEVEELFTARLDGNVLRGKGTKKIQKLNGQEQQATLDEIEMRIQNGKLVGRFGNQNDGVTSFAIDRQQQQGGGAAPTAPSINGVWGGQVSDRMQDGSTLTYPLRISIQGVGQGRYKIELYAEVTLKGQQGPVQAKIAQEATGVMNGGVLTMRGTRKVISLGGQAKQVPVDNGEMRLVNGMLVGKAGNQENGYTQFRLKRQR